MAGTKSRKTAEKEGWANADAKLRLILAAEELIGDNGVARTSLREISRHAGHANVGAAQYHFGDKANLLAAVMQYRRPALDRQRQALFAERGYDMATASVAQLISLINESLFDQSGENGVRSFARFLRGIELEDIFSQLWLNARETAPFTDELYAAMHRRMPGLPLDIWELRRRQLGLFATTNIADFDRYRSRIKISPRQFLDELNKVTAAGLTA